MMKQLLMGVSLVVAAIFLTNIASANTPRRMGSDGDALSRIAKVLEKEHEEAERQRAEASLQVLHHSEAADLFGREGLPLAPVNVKPQDEFNYRVIEGTSLVWPNTDEEHEYIRQDLTARRKYISALKSKRNVGPLEVKLLSELESIDWRLTSPDSKDSPVKRDNGLSKLFGLFGGGQKKEAETVKTADVEECARKFFWAMLRKDWFVCRLYCTDDSVAKWDEIGGKVLVLFCNGVLAGGKSLNDVKIVCRDTKVEGLAGQTNVYDANQQGDIGALFKCKKVNGSLMVDFNELWELWQQASAQKETGVKQSNCKWVVEDGMRFIRVVGTSYNDKGQVANLPAPELLVRVDAKNKLELFVCFGEKVNNEKVLLSVDGEEPAIEKWNASVDCTAVFYPYDNIPDLIKNKFGGKVVRVMVKNMEGAVLMASFNIEGFAQTYFNR